MVNKASAFDMNALDSRIKELVTYARERDGEDRTILFRNLVDLFLTGKAPLKDPTRTQLLDVLEALIPHVDVASRRTVADLVASMSFPPLDLAIRLCRDRAALVTNLLKQAAFDEDDILDLIARTGREHHQILAARDDLSANVWIALARAAPSAPPFDHQSTLALWSDDLGITRTATTTDKNKPASATVTPLRREAGSTPSSKPSIRIIKTGDDLAAERALTTDTEEPETIMFSDDTQHGTHEQKQNSSDEQKITKKAAHVATEQIENELNPILQQFIQDDTAAKPLKDPGPGGWAWQSDRDGLISSISPKGRELLGNDFEKIGTTMLDILGLNNKLGHPVARAFQRRSPIHDAPIFLASLEPHNQRWTLEATPFFSSGGGIFEGYEGVLTPINANSKKETLLESEENANALFLEDIQPTQQAVGADTYGIPQTHAAQNFAHDSSASTLNTQVQKPQVASAAPQTYSSAPSEMGPLASSALEDVISASLKPLTDALDAHTMALPTPKAAPAVKKAQPAASKIDPEVRTTLDLLEEALARLTISGKSTGGLQVRLQSEIASACVRTLRDILSR